MKHLAGALLLLLLPLDEALATVYVWRDDSGALVMSNQAADVPDTVGDSLVKYETMVPAGTEKGSARAADVAAADAGQQQPRKKAAAAAQPDPARAPTADGPAAVQRRLGAAPVTDGAAAQATSQGASSARIDPRDLVARAAQRDPPRVFVSVVPSSSRPLSTSARTSSSFGDRSSGSGTMSSMTR